MRGKGIVPCIQRRFVGITPAYAGKSVELLGFPWSSRDHPRICGEKSFPVLAASLPMGSPPHMRGKATLRLHLRHIFGITPAYAGKSSFVTSGIMKIGDHPRICGEKTKKIP